MSKTTNRVGPTLALGLVLGWALPVSAQPSNPAASAPEKVSPVASQPITNIPNKRLVSVIVDYPAGASSVPHRHPASAFIYAYVISGEVRSAVDGEQAKVYRAGESWFEKPGAHHVISENASNTRPARLLAVFIVDDKDSEKLTTPDAR